MTATESNYKYDPSVPAAIVFAILYTITATVTTFQYFYHRCWFWLFMVIASIMEAIGYIARIVSVKNPDLNGPFIVEFLMIFLAPALMAASCYMAMGRVVLHVTPTEYCNVKSLWVAPRWMTPIFVTCDVIAFLIQVLGGIESVSKNISTEKRGFDIAKIGLIVQLCAFGFFIVISFRFHVFAKRFRNQWPESTWVRFLWAINIAACLIFVRSLYRLIEFSLGAISYLQSHEWAFYVFETAVIFPVPVIFTIIHPSSYLQNIGWRQNKKTKIERLESSNVEMGAQQGVTN